MGQRSSAYESAVAQARVAASKWMRQTGMPIDLRQVASELGVSRIESRPLPIDGYLAVQENGEVIIRYCNVGSEERSRFTVAHEIAHILIAQYAGETIHGSHYRGWRREDDEERLADRIAAEILMPHDYVLSRVLEIDVAGSRWAALQTLRQQLLVSNTTLALRLLELSGLIAVFFRIGYDGIRKFDRRYYCKTSEWSECRFPVAPLEIAAKFLKEASNMRVHQLRMEADRNEYHMRCEGCVRHIGAKTEYWVIGWEVLQQRPEGDKGM